MAMQLDFFLSREAEPTDPSPKYLATFSRSEGGKQVHFQRWAAVSGDHRYGSTASLAPGATATLVTFVVPADVITRVRGFHGTGTGDGRFALLIAGTERYFGVLSVVNRAPESRLPVPHDVATGVLVELKVTNTSAATANYQGVLYAE